VTKVLEVEGERKQRGAALSRPCMCVGTGGELDGDVEICAGGRGGGGGGGAVGCELLEILLKRGVGLLGGAEISGLQSLPELREK